MFYFIFLFLIGRASCQCGRAQARPGPPTAPRLLWSPTWESEPVCMCVCVCVCVCEKELKWVYRDSKWKACQIFLHLQTLFSLFVSVFTAMRQYLRAQSSQSSAYDNRTAQTCGSSQCCLPLLHTSPNLRLSLSFSHSSSLPPSPFAFVLRDRALLTWCVTIVAESIL